MVPRSPVPPSSDPLSIYSTDKYLNYFHFSPIYVCMTNRQIVSPSYQNSLIITKSYLWSQYCSASKALLFSEFSLSSSSALPHVYQTGVSVWSPAAPAPACLFFAATTLYYPGGFHYLTRLFSQHQSVFLQQAIPSSPVSHWQLGQLSASRRNTDRMFCNLD